MPQRSLLLLNVALVAWCGQLVVDGNLIDSLELSSRSDSLSDDDELIVDFKRLMSVGGGQQHQQGCLDDDVFHNNNNSPAETPRRSR